MVSPTKAGFDLRERSPLPRNILHSREMRALADTGQRVSPEVCCIPKGYRDWLCIATSQKDAAGKPEYPAATRDTAESGMGRMVTAT